ncbi:hypothetical protein ZHAS_00021720 [Anopheles sinensis]|uniref:Uncharacterized protein n=1 Tax=Anopheles sinensis TaxID=74873 RepID=A0A084WTF0_ANOSI|nr:hypothetical protein ZHAS_00021720 [Anopheles sinensis]
MRRQRSHFEPMLDRTDVETGLVGGGDGAGTVPPLDGGAATAGSASGRKSPFRSRRLSVCRKRALGIFQRSASVSVGPSNGGGSGSCAKSESSN